jgi:uncharacterized integral membrane protein
MFYLKITMLLLLLLLFVCFLQNEKCVPLLLWDPGFPPLMLMVFVHKSVPQVDRLTLLYGFYL